MSKAINIILNMQDRMTPKILRVSKKVDGLSKDVQRATTRFANMGNKFSASVDKMVAKAGRLAKIGAGMAVAGAGAGAVQMIKQSDTYTGIQARLSLINDGQQSVAEFNEKIFKSADRARGKYTEMADIVGKLGIVASKSFKNNDEILQFSELLTKNFKIAGASAEEQSSATYQLAQAMGAGKLQGDEFRSIMENAPLLAQAIAKEMKIPIGKLKEMSSDGLITADIIKSALLNSADEINEKYAQMPVTFSDVASKMQNLAINKLQPTFQKMSQWLNSEKGEASIGRIIDIVSKLVAFLPVIFNKFSEIYAVIKKVYDIFIKYQDLILLIATFTASIIMVTKAISILKNVFTVLQIAILLFNGTLALTPLGWIVIGISAVIAVGVLLWKNWDTIKEKLGKAFEIIKEKLLGVFKKIQDVINKVKEFFGFKDHKVNLEVNTTESNYSKSNGNTYGPKATIPRHATGTSYFQGGLTSINEHGGEIIDLKNGAQIIPSDKSDKLLDQKSGNIINININSVGKSTKEIVDEFVAQLKLVLVNM